MHDGKKASRVSCGDIFLKTLNVHSSGSRRARLREIKVLRIRIMSNRVAV
jgi:hypothetical protein